MVKILGFKLILKIKFYKVKIYIYEYSNFKFNIGNIPKIWNISYICIMEIYDSSKIKRAEKRHRPGVSEQTGFPSPATHYLEPTIDLHQELITNSDATFFIRVQGNAYEKFNIYDKSVLIIDRSLPPINNRLALVVNNGEFKIVRISPEPTDEITLWGVVTYIINKV